MVGKVISASSFSGTVGYVMKEESRILEAEGITPPEVKDMVQDFKDQTLLNPRLKNTVGHISLSFSPKDAPRMTDALMTQIAKEYMQKMGITDTQYLLVRHLVAVRLTANKGFCSRKTASSSPDRRSTGLSTLRNSTTGSTIFNNKPNTGQRSSGTSRRRQAITVQHLQGCSAVWVAAARAKSRHR